MHPEVDSSLPESLAFLLILAVVILVLRVTVKMLLNFLPRWLRRIYNRFTAAANQSWARSLYEPVARRFPLLASRLARRFSLTHFAGLPLILLAAAAVYAAALAVNLTFELVLEPEDLADADRALQAHLQPFRNGPLVAVFAWITDLGSNVTLVALSVAATAFALAGGRTVDVLPLWVTVLGTQVFTWTAKLAIDRERPEFITDVVVSSPSFPSGHSSGSLAIYGFIAYMLAREVRSPSRRFEIVFWVMILVGLIGFSRLFLHVHYASDVIAGYLVGGFWLIVGIAIAEWRRADRQESA